MTSRGVLPDPHVVTLIRFPTSLKRRSNMAVNFGRATTKAVFAELVYALLEAFPNICRGDLPNGGLVIGVRKVMIKCTDLQD